MITLPLETIVPIKLTQAVSKSFAKTSTLEQVRTFTIVKTPLGDLAICATKKGICLVNFISSKNTFICELALKFPQTSIKELPETELVLEGRSSFELHDTKTPSPEALQFCSWKNLIISYLSGKQQSFPSLDFDISGTEFQKDVWKYLQSIPYGELRTYTQVANAIKKPFAVRAVANACGANPLALLIPCHRVVRTGGMLGGYRWGIERKKSLLQLEGVSKLK